MYSRLDAAHWVLLLFLSNQMAIYFLLNFTMVAASPFFPVLVLVRILTLSPIDRYTPLLLMEWRLGIRCWGVLIVLFGTVCACLDWVDPNSSIRCSTSSC